MRDWRRWLAAVLVVAGAVSLAWFNSSVDARLSAETKARLSSSEEFAAVRQTLLERVESHIASLERRVDKLESRVVRLEGDE